MTEVREIPWRDPAEAFAPWADAPYVAWLDSASAPEARSRFSYVAIEPFRVVATGPAGVTVDERRVEGDPLAVLQAELAACALPAGDGPTPFSGGAVGFLGYGLRHCLECLPSRHKEDPRTDMVMAFYDVVLAFDRVARRAWIVSSGLPAPEGSARRDRAETRAAEVLDRLAHATPTRPALLPRAIWTADLTRTEYEGRVQRVLEHIRAGDISQANFTTRFTAPRPAALRAADLYLRLRRLSPAPFAAYLGCGAGLALASASPERFLQLDFRDATGRVETRPIKGTRPRGADPSQDATLRLELAASEKDRAENLMIVDLMRNDIGRVAELGSVAVASLWMVESFASVHHLVSAVVGRLRPGLGAVDLLRATFPGGSVTGSPKIQAMRVIDAVETAPRGPYCGTIAWIGFDGAMDSSIVIRTLVVTPEQIVAQAGGGIVADSDPAAEYEEMRVKIAPLLQVLDGATA